MEVDGRFIGVGDEDFSVGGFFLDPVSEGGDGEVLGGEVIGLEEFGEFGEVLLCEELDVVWLIFFFPGGR